MLRLVKTVSQGFPEQLFGADHVIRTLFQILDDLSGFGVLRHKVTLVDFQILVHCRAEPELEVSAAVNLHRFCPDLYEISSCCRFIVKNVDFCQLWMNHDQHKTAVAGAVKGQEVQRIGSAAEHTLPFSVSRVGFVWHFIGFLLATEKRFDFLNTLGIGGGNHLRHLNQPVSLHLAIHIFIVQFFQVIGKPVILNCQQPKE